jgi:TetR/AcrR family transcriptional regulator
VADPRRQRTVDALLRAAQEVFASRAVDEVTVEEIADAAGTSVGSLYNHFGSKAGLHAAVVERAVEVDRAFMDLAYTADRSPVEQLYAAAEEYLRFYLEAPEYFRMLAFPAGPGRYRAGQDLAERLARSVDEQNARMVAALEGAIAAGIARDVDPQAMATVLWASWNGIISLAWRPDALSRTEEELRDLLRVATDAIAHGLLTERE